MKLMVFVTFCFVILFLLFYVIAFCTETRKRVLNPRPRMYDEGPRFREVARIKTQNMYYIKER